MQATKPKNEFSEKEAQERFEAALRGALKTPHEPLKEKPKKKRNSKVEGVRRMRLRILDWLGVVFGIAFKVNGRPFGAADVRELD